jgi:hypothetical protein
MDASEQIAWSSELAWAVLGKGAEFVLIDLTGPIDDATTATALAKGFTYCGVMGVKDGQAGVKCEPTLDAAVTMTHAALAFAAQMAGRTEPKGDSLEWLERLYMLPDPRMVN